MQNRKKIEAALLTSPNKPLEFREVFLDSLLPGEVRVKSLAAGLCHSDLHYLNGTLPISLPAVLGHEVLGEIVEVADEQTGHRLGQRVIATITPACGVCARCITGLSTQCLRTSSLRERARPKLLDSKGEVVTQLGSIGAFSEEFIIKEVAAVQVADFIPNAEGCLMGCAVATGFGSVVHGAKVSPLDSVAVIGCGGVGIAAIQAAKIAGAKQIIAIDLHEEKLQRAITFGATNTVKSDGDVIAQIREILPLGVDKSFEAVGSPVTAALAFEMLATGGTATILGLEKPGSHISINAELLIEGDRHLQGAYMGANQLSRDVETFAQHYLSGDLQLGNMVTSRWAFTEINEGFESMKDPSAIRAVVEW